MTSLLRFRRSATPSSRAGFTLIELLMVVTITGLMVAIVAPKFRITEVLEVQLAGQQLQQDIDFVRTRALAARSLARVTFDNSSLPAYSGYLDTDADSTIAETALESQELHGFGRRELPPRVAFGRASVPALPTDPTSSAITFAGTKVDFNSRGIVQPMGQGGVVYLKHTVKTGVVVAVEVTPAGNVRMWTYKNGSWQ
ncbi:MAG: prepilin-type N-terminal cleavage/methylation domain-containing protein [Phycisphaerae bacterium]|nr:prepilin-type N-terminal cleavage/methylation domain-containing protein [Gemmatimonadaceae bacterium]